MFNRIRASIAGEPAPSPPEKSTQQPTSRSWSHQNAPSSPQPQRGAGFLSPFFSSNPPPNGTERNAVSPQPQKQQTFFGGLLPQAASPLPAKETPSPATIRASASALLKLATPPPLADINAHPEINPNSNLNDGIDGADLAQRDTLEHQINRRDQYISKLQHDLQRMQNQLSQYQKDSATLRRQQLESTHRHGIAIKLWRRTNDGLRARVECFENETTPAAAREIANLIRDAAPPNKDSAYLMMLQDQLTKANVKLDHLGSQTEIVLHKGEEVVESLREEMNEVIRERCRMELELLDQERMLEDDMRRMVLKTERRLKRVQGEIDFLEKNAVEVLKNQEEDEKGSDAGSAGSDDDDQEGASDKKVDKEEEGVKDEDKKGEEKEDGEGDDNSELGVDRKVDNNTENATKPKENSEAPSKNGKKEEHTPDVLRKELRKVAMERDRSLSVLQKKLREKNEEYHNLMRLRESREKSIKKLEGEKRDREEWERSRQDMLMP
eukprot:CAMPEP_0183717940 /NCGR_PEP_ID=MMETSP0737-20130205/11353_1 /TAXON_ID=385413 /ORGANISM="Thalassiosira miniscula, Strain CCMP1093" /LENGTH=495 /DNA_ID=CAMNT_0025947417 /DNA_START=265 /DNA_END=1752 /DNA_ORIENTATION=+